MDEPAAPQAVIAADAPAPSVSQAPEPVTSNPSPEADVLQNAFDSALLQSALFPAGEKTALPPVEEPQAPAQPEQVQDPAGVKSPEQKPNPTEPKAAETEPPEPVDPEQDDDVPTADKILPSRMRTKQFKHQQDKEAIALQYQLGKQGQDITLAEAVSRVAAKYSEPAAQPELDPATPEADPQPSELDRVNEELAELRAQRDDQYAGQNLTSVELAELQTKIEDLTVEAKLLARDQANSQKRQQQEQAQQSDAVMQEVLKEYPAAGDDETYLGARVAAKIADIRGNPNHAERALLTGKDAPRKIVAQVEKEALPRVMKDFGISEAQALSFLRTGSLTEPAQAPATPAPPAGPKPVPRTLGVTAPGATAGPAPTPQANAQDVLNATLSDPKLAAQALGFGGGGWNF